MITNSIKFGIKSQELMKTLWLWFLTSQMHLSEQMITELTSFFSFGYQLLYCALYKESGTNYAMTMFIRDQYIG